MTEPDLLQDRFPGLQEMLPRVELACLPTPVHEVPLDIGGQRAPIWVKADNLTGKAVGGNKVRKLEYLFGQLDRSRTCRVATYGTVASNHALATALLARQIGLESICFLAHQTQSTLARDALGWHQENGTELVPFVGRRPERIRLQREVLWNRAAAVIAPGGSSWRGSAGFVNAGLELAAQIQSGELPCPDRLYMAAGTLGSVAGLAIGFAVAGLDIRIEAVRVSHTGICNEEVLARLCKKTCVLLNRGDGQFPVDAWRRANVRLRHDFFGPGYAKPCPATVNAMAIVAGQTDLGLEATYTGKAMAALLNDFAECVATGERQLFWNTYHALGAPETIERERLPAPFRVYVDES